MNIDIHQHIGQRPSQEDRFVVAPTHDGYLLAVLDGHGGPGVAEDVAVALPGRFQRALEASDDTPAQAMEQLFAGLFEDFTRTREIYTDLFGGSTLSLAFVQDERITTAVLGDSPILLRIDGEDWIAPAHNVDLNPRDVARIEATHQDRILRGELHITSSHIQLASWQALAVTRALGDPDFARYLIREPEIHTHPVAPGADVALILATDAIQVSTDAEVLREDYIRLLEQVANGRSARDLGRQHASDPRCSDNLTIITATRGEA